MLYQYKNNIHDTVKEIEFGDRDYLVFSLCVICSCWHFDYPKFFSLLVLWICVYNCFQTFWGYDYWLLLLSNCIATFLHMPTYLLEKQNIQQHY